MQKKKDANIELIRIVAIVLVVSLHIWQGSGIDEMHVYVKGVLRAFQRNGVPLFFMIMGFFLFEGKKSWGAKVIQTLKKVVLPAVLMMFVTYVIRDWVSGTRTIWDCLIHIQLDWKELLVNLLNWSTNGQYCLHLWYVFAYLKVVLWFPILKLLCVEDESADATKYRRILMLLCVIQMLLKNVQYIFVDAYALPAQLYIYSPIDYTLLYVLLGFELHQWIKKGGRIKQGYLVALYLGGNLGICAMEFLAIKLGVISGYFENIDNVFILVSSVAMFVFLYQVPIGETNKKIVCYLGNKVFYIYLVHYVIAKHIPNIRWIQSVVGVPGVVKYVGCIVYVFVVSLFIAIFISFILRVTNRCLGKRHETINFSKNLNI